MKIRDGAARSSGLWTASTWRLIFGVVLVAVVCTLLPWKSASMPAPSGRLDSFGTDCVLVAQEGVVICHGTTLPSRTMVECADGWTDVVMRKITLNGTCVESIAHFPLGALGPKEIF